MEQQTELILEKKPWVLVSSLQEDTTEQDLQQISPLIKEIIDEWQSKGNIMWSGAFSNNRTSMAIFEATDTEAKELFAKYDKICSGMLVYELYEWDAMPILSILSKN